MTDPVVLRNDEDGVAEPGAALETALAYARTLAETVSPSAMAGIKAQLYRHATASLDATLEDSNALVRHMLEGPDFPEGVAAFREKLEASCRPRRPTTGRTRRGVPPGTTSRSGCRVRRSRSR